MKTAIKIHKAKKGLIAFIVFVPILTYLLGKFLPELPSSSMLKDNFWANKISNGKLYDIVVIGDSRIYRGVDPYIISKKSGASVFNYGFSSAGLDSIIMNEAIKLLNPNGKKILLIGISPASFTDESLKNEHLFSLKKINLKDLWIQKNIYPYLTFFNTYSLSDLKKISLNEKYFQTFYQNGFVYSNKIPTDTFEALQPYIEFLKKNKISEVAESSFLKLINHLHSKEIKVYAFRVPIASPIEKLENSFFNFTAFETAFKANQGHWIKLPELNLKSYDGSHLDGSSAQKLSYCLADSLINIQ